MSTGRTHPAVPKSSNLFGYYEGLQTSWVFVMCRVVPLSALAFSCMLSSISYRVAGDEHVSESQSGELTTVMIDLLKLLIAHRICGCLGWGVSASDPEKTISSSYITRSFISPTS